MDEIDGDLENTFGGLNDLLEFFGVIPQISIKVNLSSGEVAIFFKAKKSGYFDPLSKRFILLLLVLSCMRKGVLLISWVIDYEILPRSWALR